MATTTNTGPGQTRSGLEGEILKFFRTAPLDLAMVLFRLISSELQERTASIAQVEQERQARVARGKAAYAKQQRLAQQATAHRAASKKARANGSGKPAKARTLKGKTRSHHAKPRTTNEAVDALTFDAPAGDVSE